jgi:hypothetical protein
VIYIDGVCESLAFFGIGTPDHFFNGIDELIHTDWRFFLSHRSSLFFVSKGTRLSQQLQRDIDRLVAPNGEMTPTSAVDKNKSLATIEFDARTRCRSTHPTVHSICRRAEAIPAAQ